MKLAPPTRARALPCHASTAQPPDLCERVTLHAGAAQARIAAVGDVSLGPRVASAAQRHGASHPFGAVEPLFSRCDLVFGNLEYPLTRSRARHPIVRHVHRQAPPETVELLRDAGFDVLGIANNHMLDCLAEGLSDTVETLAGAGIRCVGAGSSLAAARAPAILAAAGLRFGFLSYTYPLHQIATQGTAGCAPNDPALMLEDVRELRDRCDHVIVSIHAGREFYHHPSAGAQRTSRRLVEEGARAVLFHHAHVPLGLEPHAGGVIAYGLGNFLCNIHDLYRRVASPHLHRGLLLELDFDAERLLGFEVRPTEITPELSVRPLEGAEADRVKRWLTELSAPLGDPAEVAALVVRARLQRVLQKARSRGVPGLLADQTGKAAAALRNRLLRGRRERALEQALSDLPAPIEPNGVPHRPPQAAPGRGVEPHL